MSHRSITALVLLTAVGAPHPCSPAEPGPLPREMRFDLLGDPLPPEAVSRLGTTRYRLGDWGPRMFFARDGSRILWVAQDKTVTVFDADTGKATETYRDPDLPGSWISDLSPDGTRLAQFEFARSDKGEFSQVLRLYDLKARKTAWTARAAGTQPASPTAVRFTPDGKRILTLSRPGDVRVWDAATGDELRREKVAGDAYRFELSPDGKTVAFGASDVFVWDWEGDKPARKLDVKSRFSIDTFQFSADGKTLYVTGYGRALPKGYDVATGRMTGYLDLGERADWFSFSPDGRTVAYGRNQSYADSGNRTGEIVLKDLSTGKELRRLSAAPARPSGAQWSQDGSRLASTTGQRVCVFDVKTGKLLGPDPPGHDGPVYAIAFAPDGRVFTAAHDRAVRAWDPATGKALQTLLTDTDWVPGLAVSPDGSLVAASGLQDHFPVWDARTGKEVFRLLGHGRSGGVRLVRFSADEQTLLSWGDDMTVRAFDALTGKLRSEHRFLPPGLAGEDEEEARQKMEVLGIEAREADLGPDGKTLVLARGKDVFVYAADTGKERFRVEADPVRVEKLALSPDGKWLATAGPGEVPGKGAPRRGSDEPRNDQVTVWDMATGSAVVKFRVPTRVWWGVLAFTPDGRRVVTGSWDPALAFWDAKTGKPAGTLGLPHRAQCVAFRPDGKQVVVGFLDTTAVVYDVDKALEPAPANPPR
jgi:WD40 repeat protein